MSDIPSELCYASSHEWIRVEEDNIVTIGVTDHAQAALGDIVFVELPEVGTEVIIGDETGVIESVKAASDIYAPLSGEVIAVNETLNDTPEYVNSEPYGEGWFFRMKLIEKNELSDLMDANTYAELCEFKE
ncbi:MAG: glycine cleavage system protein GcvH [Endozoicomonadaceae bacterium]|nr:glycine cleavage system protein GcvH [Endozoicomonadaceae bacterium]